MEILSFVGTWASTVFSFLFFFALTSVKIGYGKETNEERVKRITESKPSTMTIIVYAIAYDVLVSCTESAYAIENKKKHEISECLPFSQKPVAKKTESARRSNLSSSFLLSL